MYIISLKIGKQINGAKDIKYYNSERLHKTLNDMSPIEFVNIKEKRVI